jgi:hypothetical protein
VRDIVEGKGPWSAMPDNELTARIRLKVIETIDSVAYGLAMKAMAKLDEDEDNVISGADIDREHFYKRSNRAMTTETEKHIEQYLSTAELMGILRHL